jgi:hypothetical protein
METNKATETTGTPEMSVEPIVVRDPLTGSRTPMFVCHGPDGHEWLLKRLSAEAAMADGVAYFMATRTIDASGRWVL